mgnify:CR=1 FL=1
MIYEELTVNGKNYLLVHGRIGKLLSGKDMEEYSIKELIWDRLSMISNILKIHMW